MNIIYQLDPGAYAPVRAHPDDAGFDLRAKWDIILPAGMSLRVDTGLHLLLPPGFTALVLPRSSYSANGFITPSGVIDSGFTGAISVVLRASRTHHVRPGDRIAQLVVLPLPSVTLIEGNVDNIYTERGSGGFGSTGE